MSCVHDEEQIERWTAELLGRGAGRWEVLPPPQPSEHWSSLRVAVVMLVGAGLVVVVVVLGIPIVTLVMGVLHFAL